jgi:hypothetical protein
MMGTEIVPKMLVSFDHLMWLMAEEDFIEFGYHKSFKSYTIG